MTTKERPILFSAPMVRALLDGSKTQTRRVFKAKNGGVWPHMNDIPGMCQIMRNCPYGQPGDRLWVRETFIQGWPWIDGIPDQFDEDDHEKPMHTWFRATEPGLSWTDDDGGFVENTPWKPSIHMPRTASRITLEITGVRVERLQDISEADAAAEGVSAKHTADAHYTAREAYAVLWEQINGPDSWAENPWVWVIEFKKASQ